ncbi:MAG: tubulin-like doman-containing protein [Pyrinomonadaceae bacterium]
MSFYAIGIGGTGAKCLESLIHLAAAGLIPGHDKKLYLLFVDPDGSNGSLARAGKLLETYTSAQAKQFGGADFLDTKVRSAKDRVWSPLSQQNNNLGNFVNYGTLETDLQHLFDVLYSKEEKETSLDKGFRGHPSIGATVMAAAFDLEASEPWQQIKNNIELEINNGRKAKIMLFGSIFGGTGASGFPTIARLLRNWIGMLPDGSACLIGGTLMLPYFSFETVGGEELKAEAKDFLLNTQAALQYYYQKEEIKELDCTYLVGSDDSRQVRQTAIGGQEQENEPHWVEMVAGLAAVDFFAQEHSARGDYFLIARESPDRLSWTDLPDEHGKVKTNILQLTRFAFAFLSTYMPMLEDILANGRGYRAPWYIDYFARPGVDLRSSLQEELRYTQTYCRDFVLWLANVEYSVNGKIDDQILNLIDFTSFAEEREDKNGKRFIALRKQFSLDAFQNIILPNMKSDVAGLEVLWERMCSSKPKIQSNSSAWAFINQLYRLCGVVD